GPCQRPVVGHRSRLDERHVAPRPQGPRGRRGAGRHPGPRPGAGPAGLTNVRRARRLRARRRCGRRRRKATRGVGIRTSGRVETTVALAAVDSSWGRTANSRRHDMVITHKLTALGLTAAIGLGAAAVPATGLAKATGPGKYTISEKSVY